MVTHYEGSKGKIALEAMNPYHLHNAIKKLTREASDADLLAALKAEQDRRGGPPADAK